MSVSMLSTFVKPMHPEGRRSVAIAAAITLVFFLIWAPLGWIGLGLTIWVYYFFRDPERATPIRVAEEVSTPDRQDHTRPTKNIRQKNKCQRGHSGKQCQKLVPFLMDWDKNG